MPKIFPIFLTLAVLLFSTITLSSYPIYAQEEESEDIPAAVLAPNSPFYFVRQWQEAIESFVASLRSTENQANLELEFARRRVAEMRKLANLAGQEERIDALQERWQAHIDRLQELAEQITENQETHKERFLEQLDRHRAVMERVREQVPDQAKDAIDRAIGNYETNREKLLNNFEGSRRQELEERLQERLETLIEKFELKKERFQQLQENTR